MNDFLLLPKINASCKISNAKFSMSNPPNPHEVVKKLLQLEGAGRDIEKVLQRYLLMLATHDEKL